MTKNALRKAHWQSALRALAAERRPLVEKSFIGELSLPERRLLRHLERELDWYEMALLRPAFERLERQARRNAQNAEYIMRLARKASARTA